MAITLTDTWDFYRCQVEDSPFSIRLDMGLSRLPEDQLTGYRDTFFLDIRYENAYENNLPIPESLDYINRVEDALQNGGRDIYLMGIATGMNYSRFAFACAPDMGTEAQIAAILLRDCPDTPHRARLIKDDNLGYYRTFLYPTPADQNWMWDAKVCRSMAENGEDFSQPRPVDFFAYFPSREALEAFQAQAETLELLPQLTEQKEESGEWMLHMIREMVPDMGEINPLTLQLRAWAEEHGGYFDGWGAPVHKAADLQAT